MFLALHTSSPIQHSPSGTFSPCRPHQPLPAELAVACVVRMFMSMYMSVPSQHVLSHSITLEIRNGLQRKIH